MPKLIPSFIVLAYLLLTLLIGFRFKKQASVSIDEFYLAGRSLSPLILFFTMMSTNFSAFTIFGLSGAGYRIGYAFYPVMGFGTGFMAISFFIIGLKILRLSKERGYITRRISYPTGTNPPFYAWSFQGYWYFLPSPT